ncbi:type II toxin-antitoxin system death-on-curing family toxin [Salsipaludibacter albus]|uniref:type II toxin-antitoxin system death-on-curing family toxin n=1 Tax=Salsipaludibacter albus TaxID=2849650 RepID=UPI001EE3A72D|nr:Fic family protein [Salsipaludibacter albus]
MAWNYLDLADFLLIAEAVLDIPAEDLASAARLDLADSALHAPAAAFAGTEFYPDLAAKTAVLASRIIRNHPLPDGNKRVGYLCALEFVARNGGTWTRPVADEPDGDETVAVIESVAAGTIDEDDLRDWVGDRLG